jgi:hypothetical protein
MDELFQNWSETKEALLEGLTPAKRAIVAPLLENQKNQVLAETASAGSVQAHDIANFRKILVPMIRRVIPGTIASELVGVQPMTGPVGLVYSLRFRYGDTVTAEAASLNGAYASPAGNYTSGQEMFANSPQVTEYYSSGVGSAQGAGAGGIDMVDSGGDTAAAIGGTDVTGNGWGSSSDSTTHDTSTDGFGFAVDGSMRGGSGSFLEGSGGRKGTLQVISQAVEARTRKLQAGWTIEAMQDLQSQHGLDIEDELTKALSSEIVMEIDNEIINDLIALAGTVRTYDFSATDGPNYAPAFVGDRFANLGVVINSVANEIARKTRRGAANYIVVSPMIVSVLQSAAKAVFAPAVEGSFKGPNNTMLAGTLNGTIKVYTWLWNQAVPVGASNSGYTAGADTILVGYKGGNGETDTGYFYCPYVPLMSSGVVVHPVTFQPVVSLMTRYGKTTFTNTTSSLGNSADYYGKVNVSNLAFI